MNHVDHVNLLRGGITESGGLWADLGAGAGAFTLALAELVGSSAEIYAVDRDGGALKQQERTMREQFPATKVHYRTADFTRPLDLPLLDGVVMANSLHFHRQKNPILQLVRGYIKQGGRLLVVEYNVDSGNTWVPYPLSYPTWAVLAKQNGFSETRLLASRPSRFLKEIYSAVSVKD
ncbi:MAG: methyltransferase domain-containing protein [Chitinophagaceae bacterium]|nr:methyltransferase domain-containing protein [Anaerolineae bacterium]